MDQNEDTEPRIVVGVDGSPSSRQALRWAARQAKLTEASLEVVTGWEWPVTFAWVPLDPSDSDPGMKPNATSRRRSPTCSATTRASRSGTRWQGAMPQRCYSRRPKVRPSLSWEAGGTGPSPESCSDRSASIAWGMRRVRSRW